MVLLFKTRRVESSRPRLRLEGVFEIELIDLEKDCAAAGLFPGRVGFDLSIGATVLPRCDASVIHRKYFPMTWLTALTHHLGLFVLRHAAFEGLAGPIDAHVVEHVRTPVEKGSPTIRDVSVLVLESQ